MPNERDPAEPWDGDVNEAALEDWKNATTAFDRIATVINTTSEPAFAREIAERAAVAEPTARRHLKSFVETGRVKAVPVDGGTKYKRAPSTIAMKRIAGLHTQYSKEGLQDAIADLREKLTTLREKHGISDADDLATELEIGDNDWTDVSRMRDLEENLDIAKAALNLYDFDPDTNGTNPAETGETSTNGALAGFREHTSA